MVKLSDISSLVPEHLDASKKILRQSLSSKIPLVDTVLRYLVRRSGKQVRPIFVLLSAGMHGEITSSAHRAAALIELLHTATLVHDDVVDEAWQRRGMLSLNAIWRNKIAVLAGDYILSRGMLLALEHREYDQLHIVSEATREMSEGELLQIEKARRLDINQEVYFEIIRKKTASLIASCCATGAAAAGATPEVIERMRLFGEMTGIAFQIKDDLFDYTAGSRTGKSTGTDLREKKLTLPVIYMMQQLNTAERMMLKYNLRMRKGSDKKFNRIMEMVISYGGVEYAGKKMLEYRDGALAILEEFPHNHFAEGLKNLVLYTTDRKR